MLDETKRIKELSVEIEKMSHVECFSDEWLGKAKNIILELKDIYEKRFVGVSGIFARIKRYLFGNKRSAYGKFYKNVIMSGKYGIKFEDGILQNINVFIVTRFFNLLSDTCKNSKSVLYMLSQSVKKLVSAMVNNKNEFILQNLYKIGSKAGNIFYDFLKNHTISIKSVSDLMEFDYNEISRFAGSFDTSPKIKDLLECSGVIVMELNNLVIHFQSDNTTLMEESIKLLEEKISKFGDLVKKE